MTERSPSVRSYTFERVVLIIIGVLLVGAVIGIALGLSHYKKFQAARWITLSDGSRVEVVGVTLGDAPFNSEKPWERFTRRLLPAMWTGWIPPAVTNYGWGGLDSNTLTVFLLVKSPSATVATTYDWSGITPEDENGLLYWDGGARSSYSGPPGYTVQELIFSSYPRRQKKFLLRFADSTGAEIATWPVPNPASGPFPQWQPLPLPQNQTNGLVTLTLDRLEERLIELSGPRPDSGGSNYFHEIVARTHVTTTEVGWAGAQVKDISFSDATGNQGPSMSRREPAWKARVLISRDGLGAFGPDEKLVLANLAIPAPGSYLALNQSTNLAGVGLNVRFLAGAGELTLSNDNSVFMKAPQPGANSNFRMVPDNSGSSQSWESLGPFLMIETTNSQPDGELEVFLHYDTGNPETSDSIYYVGTAGSRYRSTFMHQISLRPPQGVKTVSMTIIVNRPLPFEFMINPADIQVSNPPASH
jgi:hypothetical protein